MSFSDHPSVYPLPSPSDSKPEEGGITGILHDFGAFVHNLFAHSPKDQKPKSSTKETKEKGQEK